MSNPGANNGLGPLPNDSGCITELRSQSRIIDNMRRPTKGYKLGCSASVMILGARDPSNKNTHSTTSRS